MDTISVTKIFTKYEPIPKWVKAAKLLELTWLTVVIPLYSTVHRPPCTGQNLFLEIGFWKNLFFPQISKKGARANENQNIKLFCPKAKKRMICVYTFCSTKASADIEYRSFFQ